MTCFKLTFIQFFCILMVIATAQIPLLARAEIDPFKEIISEHYPAALRWDNIEKNNMDFSDNQFIYKDNLHQVKLNSGEKIYIHVNKGEYLRILSTENDLDSQVVNIETSQDGLLFTKADYFKGNRNKNIIVEKETEYNRIIQLTNKGKKALIIALFLSRKDYIKKILPYRNWIKLDLGSYLLTRNPQWKSDSYYLLPENKGTDVQLEGPKRLVLNIRMKYKKYQFGQQEIQLRYTIDNNKEAISHIVTNIDHSASYTVNYRNLTVSMEESIYIDIPEGKHNLKLNTSDNVFIRLLALDNPDYLFPKLNSATPSFEQAKHSYKNRSQFTNDFFKNLKHKGYKYRLYDNQWVARYMAMNNEIRESALDAIALIKASSEKNKGLKKAEHYSLIFDKRHSFFRSIRPHNETQMLHKQYNFIISALRARNKYPGQTYILDENLSPLCKTNKADFYTPINKEDSISFRLPARKQMVDLRIIISNPASLSQQKFFVQMDNQDPKLFTLENLLQNKTGYYNTQVSEACLIRNKKRRSKKRWYPYEQYHSLSRVGFYRLKIPPEVKDIKIWRSDKESKTPLVLALQYQAAKIYSMDEALYLNIIKKIKNEAMQNLLFYVLGEDDKGFKKYKNNLPGKLSPDEVYRLKQNWQPLKLFIQSRKNTFSANYEPYENKKQKYSSEAEVEQYFRKMKKGEANRNWLSIIDIYSQLNINPDNKRYLAVHELFYMALEQQEEAVFRERLLRGKLLYDKNQQLKEFAYKQLENYYHANNLDEKLMQLYIVRALQTGSEEDLIVLTKYLIEKGNYTFGLQLGLIVRFNQSLIEPLLTAAWNLQQWDYFDYLLNKLSSKKDKNQWKLLKSFSTGDEKSVKQLLSERNAENNNENKDKNKDRNKDKQNYINRLIKESLKLHHTMTTKDDIAIVQAWSDYRKNINQFDNNYDNTKGDKETNKKIWKNVDHLIKSSHGTLTLYNQERNLYKTYYKLNPEPHSGNNINANGIRLNIFGPARIKFNVRILYDSINDKVKTTNLIIKDNKQNYFAAIYKSIPANGKIIVEKENKIPGTMQQVEYLVGEGLHRIELSVNRAPTIVSLSAEQPAITLPFIPELMTEQLLASIVRDDDPVKTSRDKGTMPECFSEGCIFLFKKYPDKNKQLILPRITDINSLQIEQRVKRHFDNTYIADQKEFITEYQLNTVKIQQQFASLCLDNNKNIHLPIKINTLNDHKVRNDKVVGNCLNNTENKDKAFKLLLKLLLYINQYPKSNDNIEIMAGAVLDAFSYLPDFRLFVPFFDHQSRWQTINSVVESAGMKRESITGWNPISNSSKIRKALLAVKNPSFILVDSRVSGISFSNFTASKLNVKIENKSFPFQRKQDIRLRYRFDNKKWKYIAINHSEKIIKLNIEMSAGDHSLAFQWLNPIANQYIPVTIESINKQGRQFITAKQDLSYHVATTDEPVIINIKGPNRVKVSARVNNEESTNFLYIKAGWHQLILNNIPGYGETLYRIYQRVRVENPRKPKIIRNRNKPVSLPFGQWFNEIDVHREDDEKKKIKINDKYSLGHQEDGTFAFGALWSESTDREDSLNDTKQSDFYEFNISHYYFSEQLNTYFDTKLLYREPTSSSAKPVYGFEETIFIKPDWLSFAIRYDYRIYNQDYKSPTGTARAWATSQRLGIEKLFNITPMWSHLPKLTLFKKHYSNKGFIRNGDVELDYDVWSKYGETHNEGIIAADTVYYYPWLDTRLSSGFKYYSDESYDFANPEHVTLNVGWLQLLDKFILNMDYRWSYYYKQKDRNWNRSSSSNKAVFKTDIFWESWVSPTQRILTNLRFTFDSKENDMSTSLGFVYYFDHGRGFRDFRPHSMSFRDLRARHRHWDVNNTLGLDSLGLEKERVKNDVQSVW